MSRESALVGNWLAATDQEEYKRLLRQAITFDLVNAEDEPILLPDGIMSWDHKFQVDFTWDNGNLDTLTSPGIILNGQYEYRPDKDYDR